MKKFLTLFAMLTLFVSMMAQTTQTKFNYQAVLRDTANNNELLRNQSGTAHIFVKVNADAVDLYDDEFMSNNDGMVNLQLTSEGINWMYVDTIYAVFTFGENTIVLNTAVTAVPYACQAGTAILTTEDIQEYLGSGVDGNDVNRIYQALQSNSDMHDAARDTIVKYIKENKDLAMKIGYHYLSQLTAADVNEAYNQALGLNQEVRDSIYSVVKSFLKDNHAMLTDLAKYYAQNATADEVNQLYQELLANESASAKVKSLLNSYFAHYLNIKGLNNCNGLTLCDVIGSMGNNTNNTTTDVVPCATSNDFTASATVNNDGLVATLHCNGNFDWTYRGFSAQAYDANQGEHDVYFEQDITGCDQTASIGSDALDFIPKKVVFTVYGSGDNCEATTFTATVQ